MISPTRTKRNATYYIVTIEIKEVRTISNRVLLQQVSHVDVHQPAALLHQVIAVRHLAAAWPTLHQSIFVQSHIILIITYIGSSERDKSAVEMRVL